MKHDKIGYNHEPLEVAEMKMWRRVNDNEVILEANQDGHLELWTKAPHYAGYAIVIDGVSYEYVRGYLNSYDPAIKEALGPKGK